MSSRISADFSPANAPLPAIQPHSPPASPKLTRVWVLQLGLLFAALFWLIAWHWETALSMVDIWWTSETFAHGMVVYPASLWLIWRKRNELAKLPVEPCYWALVPLTGACFGWLVATAGGVQAGQHFCLVVAIALLPWLVLGTRVARTIAFPLAFTLLAAPIGDFLMPIMMQHTADVTVAALRLIGMPVYREGLHFVIPSGRWSIVEACSGLRYLIASGVLGCLFAYLTYRSPWRRAAFIAASIVAPILANWVRAFMIVMIGHYSGMTLAVGVDHLIYGWVFFGFVMLLLFWVGSRWREDEPEERPVQAERADASAGPVNVRASAWATIAAASIVASGPLYAQHLQDSLTGRHVAMAAPTIAGWSNSPAATETFQPHYTGARARITQGYSRGDERVELFVGYYAAQAEGMELINFHNTVVRSSDPYWKKVKENRRAVVPGELSVVDTQLKGPGGARAVWHWYWVGGRWTSSREQAKVLHALSLLVRQRDDSAVIAVHTSADPERHDRSEARLEEFTRAALPAIERMLTTARNPAVARPDPTRPAGG